MKNKYNIPHIKGDYKIVYPDVIEEYTAIYYYIHRRIKNYNNRYNPLVFGIGLRFDLINQKTINYVRDKKK
jgi:hypothetical protein